MSTTHTRFVKALEAEYEVAVAAALARGRSDQDAHKQAFEHVKARGADTLDRLREAGLYPWDGREVHGRESPSKTEPSKPVDPGADEGFAGATAQSNPTAVSA